MIAIALVCVAVVASVALVCRAAVERARLHREAATMALDEATDERMRALETRLEQAIDMTREQGNAIALRGATRR